MKSPTLTPYSNVHDVVVWKLIRDLRGLRNGDRGPTPTGPTGMVVTRLYHKDIQSNSKTQEKPYLY